MNEQPLPFETEVRVRFRDLDAMGHVNNAIYFTYMEMARSEFFVETLEIEEPRDIPVILGSISCRFRSPARFRETLRVGLGVTRFGNRSFDILCHIRGEDDRLVATGLATMIMYDYEAGNTIPIPDSFRERVGGAQRGWKAPIEAQGTGP